MTERKQVPSGKLWWRPQSDCADRWDYNQCHSCSNLWGCHDLGSRGWCSSWCSSAHRSSSAVNRERKRIKVCQIKDCDLLTHRPVTFKRETWAKPLSQQAQLWWVKMRWSSANNCSHWESHLNSKKKVLNDGSCWHSYDLLKSKQWPGYASKSPVSAGCC